MNRKRRFITIAAKNATSLWIAKAIIAFNLSAKDAQKVSRGKGISYEHRLQPNPLRRIRLRNHHWRVRGGEMGEIRQAHPHDRARLGEKTECFLLE